jgi:hypothetical protein
VFPVGGESPEKDVYVPISRMFYKSNAGLAGFPVDASGIFPFSSISENK